MLFIYLSLVSTETERTFIIDAYHMLNKRLLGYAYKLSHDAMWAQDAAQQVFLELITNLPRYNTMADDELAKYCFTIVKNLYFRWSKLHIAQGNLELLDTDMSSGSSEVEDVIIEQLEREEVKQALMMISEIKRMIIMQKFYLGRKHSEIAKELGISVSRSQNLLAEAIQEIRKILGV